MRQICVIDAQGGGIGATTIKRLKEAFGESVKIVALGTNAIATAQMMKAGANRGASGENAISRSVRSADVIVGPLGIVMAHALMGEVTPAIAEAVAGCDAKKYLIPLSQENVDIVGLQQEPLPHLLDTLIGTCLKKEKG